MNALVKRILSGVVAGGLVLSCGYWAGSEGVFFLSGLMMWIGLFEYSSISFAKSDTTSFYGFLCIGSAYLIAHLSLPTSAPQSLALSIIIFVCFILILGRNRLQNHELIQRLWSGSLGFIYILFLPGFVLTTCRLPDGLFWFYFLLMVVFFGDIFAYFGGKTLGKRPLMPHVSPKKTLEGSFCGLLGSVLTGTLLILWNFESWNVLSLILYPLAVGFSAQIGDLTASLIKRVAEVKDSGHIMPGHGGVIDRLDGVYLAAPIVYFFATLGV